MMETFSKLPFVSYLNARCLRKDGERCVNLGVLNFALIV